MLKILKLVFMVLSLLLAISGLVVSRLRKGNTWFNGERLQNNKQATILSLVSLGLYAAAVALLYLSAML